MQTQVFTSSKTVTGYRGKQCRVEQNINSGHHRGISVTSESASSIVDMLPCCFASCAVHQLVHQSLCCMYPTRTRRPNPTCHVYYRIMLSWQRKPRLSLCCTRRPP